MPPTPSGRGPDLVQMARVRVRANVAQEDLNLQALRNAQLQGDLLRLQIQNGRLDRALKTVALIGAISGGVYTIGQGVEKYETYCERVEAEGRTTLVCPF